MRDEIKGLAKKVALAGVLTASALGLAGCKKNCIEVEYFAKDRSIVTINYEGSKNPQKNPDLLKVIKYNAIIMYADSVVVNRVFYEDKEKISYEDKIPPPKKTRLWGSGNLR